MPSFTVRRAVAIGGQVVRVVFSEEPRHRSTAGIDDARNAANYAVAIVQGAGQPLRAIAVLPAVAAFPAYGVTAAGEVGCDVQVDRPVVVGLTYQVTVASAVRSLLGDALSSPFSASCIGASRPAATRQLRRKVLPVDLASNPFAGGITVQAGDWASHQGLESTTKRVWRIVFTALGRFMWLPNFGLKVDIKKPGTLSMLNGLRTDLRQQIQQQPDIASSSTSVSLDARGWVELGIKGQTNSGETFDNTVKFSESGIKV